LLSTNGSYVDDLGIRLPGTEYGVSLSGADSEKDRFPRMVGQSVILQASRRISAACQDVLKRNQLEVRDVAWIVPHQANANLLNQLTRSLKFEGANDRLITILNEVGNTSSASMGMALDTLLRSKRIQSGDLILMPAFAAGFTWGAGLCRAV
jgi:3-oxoacyl-[acyl-carrier-protein] synthase-3